MTKQELINYLLADSCDMDSDVLLWNSGMLRDSHSTINTIDTLPYYDHKIDDYVKGLVLSN